jgi:hypothetical protein
MSIIVSVKINDGVVMAADSATTFAVGQIYENANKIVNLVKGLPIGVMTCGTGGIGNASIATLLKDLRQTKRVDEFFVEKAKEADFKWFLLLRICGYSACRPLPEIWQVALLDEGKRLDPACIQDEGNFGVRWNGEPEALDRLILGIGTVPEAAATALGMTAEQMQQAHDAIVPHLYEI